MKARRISVIAEAVGGRFEGEDAVADSVAIDSRRAAPGSLFFAIKGEHADGHAFVADARHRGAVAVVVTRLPEAGGPAILVDDTVAALGRLARVERAEGNTKVVGITGSSGKTTTKDFSAGVLRRRYTVHASHGSFNNEIGLPLTLLEAADDTDVIVCEMGARGVGHIAELCAVAAPDVGVVTNVGVAHLELFGSFDRIVTAKAELVECLSSAGTAILSADDPVVRTFAERTPARTVTFGRSADADVRAEDVELSDRGLARFDLVLDGARVPVTLAVPGEHMVQDALAAAAVGEVFEISPSDIAAALEGTAASSWRMETFENADGILVVNDAYNANPASTEAALKTVRWMSRGTRMMAVLGTMAELGPAEAEEHERVGELVARLGVDRLVTVGEAAEPIADAAIREGVEPENVASYADPSEALDDVQRWARNGDVVLFKASRVVGLEVLAEAMR